MRQLGYQAVDLIVDHMNHLKSKPVSETIDSNIFRDKLIETIRKTDLIQRNYFIFLITMCLIKLLMWIILILWLLCQVLIIMLVY